MTSTVGVKHKTYFYGGHNHPAVFCDDLYELDMISLMWTLIQMTQPKPPGHVACSLNVTSDNKLILHGGVGLHSGPLTWIFELATQNWRQYSSTKDHSRAGHTGTTAITSSVIIIGGSKKPGESLDDYTKIFNVMLEPKSLQKLAI